WLGSKNSHNDLIAAGAAMRDAVTNVLEQGIARTPDLGGSASTADIGRAVAERITAISKE
ncbi:isocitrate/isopropylmalate dehydrogenase family protein, partial [Rhodospirillales bacterium]|nr:isocitrate/isopropylmalate dehydrogenase family protein [Rhodospirillales bacterium]